MRREAGITYAEVIAIVAAVCLLAAVLLPALLGERECARRADCMSNLRQIGLALDMYAQDFNECFPTTVSANEAGKPPVALKPGDGLAGLSLLPVLGYAHDPWMFVCPNDVGYWSPPPPPLTAASCSYGYDPRHKTTHPAGTAIVADRPDPANPRTGSPNHSNAGQNLLCIDGHVVWFTRTGVGGTDGNEIYDPSDDSADPEGASHIIQ